MMDTITAPSREIKKLEDVSLVVRIITRMFWGDKHILETTNAVRFYFSDGRFEEEFSLFMSGA